MANYVSYKVCNKLILSILNRTNTVLAPWNTGLDNTYLTYPEDIGWVGKYGFIFFSLILHSSPEPSSMKVP